MALNGAAGCQSLPCAASRPQACSASGRANPSPPPPSSGLPRRLQRNQPSPLFQRSQGTRSAADGTPGALAKGRLLGGSPSIVELEKALAEAAEPSTLSLQNGLTTCLPGQEEEGSQEDTSKELLLGPSRSESGAEGAVVGWVPGSETESEPSGSSRGSGADDQRLGQAIDSSVPSVRSTDSSSLSSAEETSSPVNGAHASADASSLSSADETSQASGRSSSDERLEPPNGSVPDRTSPPSRNSSRTWTSSSRKSFSRDSSSQRYSSQSTGGGSVSGSSGSTAGRSGTKGDKGSWSRNGSEGRQMQGARSRGSGSSGNGREEDGSAKNLMEEIDERTGVEEQRHMEQLDPFADDSDAEDSDTDRESRPGAQARSTKSTKYPVPFVSEAMPSYGRLRINLDLDISRAKELIRMGKWGAAEDLMRKAILDWPDDGRPYVVLGRLLAKQGRTGAARAVYEQGCQALGGDNAYIWQCWAVLEARLGNPDRARKLFDAATAADERHAAAWHGWAMLELRAGNLGRARQLLEKGAKFCGESAYIYQSLALLAVQGGRLADARALFLRCTQLNSRAAAPWLSWALLEASQGEPATARVLFERALEASPKSKYVWQAWGVFEASQGRLALARKLLTRGVQLHPYDVVMVQSLALLEYSCGFTGAARELFREASEADPTHQPVWNAWGWMEWKEARPDVARKLFQKSIDVNSTSPGAARAFQAWGVLEEREGSIAAARKLFRMALQVDPSNDVVWKSWVAMEEREGNAVRADELRSLYQQQRVEVVEPTWDFSAVITPALDTMKAFFARTAPAPRSTSQYGTDALLDPAPLPPSPPAEATDLGLIAGVAARSGSGAEAREAQIMTGLGGAKSSGGGGGGNNQRVGEVGAREWGVSQGSSFPPSLPSSGPGRVVRYGGESERRGAFKEGTEEEYEEEDEEGGEDEEEKEEEEDEGEGEGEGEVDFDVDAFLERRLPRTWKQLMAEDAVKERSVWRRPMSLNERKKWNDSLE